MKTLLLVFTTLITFLLCYCANPDISLTPTYTVLYEEPDTLATQWFKITDNLAESDTINLAPYKDPNAKVEVSFDVQLDSNNTSTQKLMLIIDFSNQYYGCSLYTGYRYQSMISEHYTYKLFGSDFRCLGNNTAVVRMQCLTVPDTIVFSNLKILGFKVSAIIR